MPVMFRERDLVKDWIGWWIVWTEEVMFDVRLEKKALPEDGAAMGLLLSLVLELGSPLISPSLLLFLLLATPPSPPRAEFVKEPIPPITAVQGLVKLDALILVGVVKVEGASDCDTDVDVDDDAAVAVATSLALLVASLLWGGKFAIVPKEGEKEVSSQMLPLNESGAASIFYCGDGAKVLAGRINGHFGKFVQRSQTPPITSSSHEHHVVIRKQYGNFCNKCTNT